MSAKPSVIDCQEQVDELCAQCRRDGRFAYDTEFVMEDRFESEVCLIQVATESSVFIIDPFLQLDIREIWELICDEAVETIVHAGQEDLNLAARSTGRPPRHIFDLQIAAGFVGFDYPISLQRLAQSLEHVRLHKSKTLTNWRRRPLTKEQIGYAAEDVAYLPALHTELKSLLRKTKRSKWAAEEFAAFENMSLYNPTKRDRAARLKGTATFGGQQLATLGELLAWREKQARRLNRPARVVLKDYLIVEISKHAIKDVRGLRELRGLNLSGAQVREVCGAVEASQKIPEPDWPEPQVREAETPGETTLIALGTAVARSFCLDQDLAYGLASTQKSIRELVRHCSRRPGRDHSEIKLLNGWRGKSIGKVLEQVLKGSRTVRVGSPNQGNGGLEILPVDDSL